MTLAAVGNSWDPPLRGDGLQRVVSLFLEGETVEKVDFQRGREGAFAVGFRTRRVPRRSRGEWVLHSVSPQERSRERLLAMHSFQDWLAAVGATVPTPQATAGGETVVEAGGAWCWMTASLPGRDLFLDGDGEGEMTESLAENLGRALGELHRCAAGFTGTLLGWRGGPRAGLEWVREGSLAGWVNKWAGPEAAEKLLALPAAKEVDQVLAVPIQALRAVLNDLPEGPLHGDPHPGNALYHQGKVTAWLDFDLCHRGPWIFDLARLMEELNRKDPSGGWAAGARRGYEESCPLSSQEAEALSPLLILVRGDSLISGAMAEVRQSVNLKDSAWLRALLSGRSTHR